MLKSRTRSKQLVLTGLLLVLTISITLGFLTTINANTKTKSSPNLPLQSKQTTTKKSNDYMEWNKTYGGSSLDEGWCVKQTSDGGYIITSTASFCLIKTDENGNVLWRKTGSIGYYVQQTTDGGYIVATRTESYGAGSADFWLIKTDENGNHEWNKTYRGPVYDKGYYVEQTSDGGYIITGVISSFDVNHYSYVWLIKLSSDEGDGSNFFESDFIF